jgi:hypothetical protein
LIFVEKAVTVASICGAIFSLIAIAITPIYVIYRVILLEHLGAFQFDIFQRRRTNIKAIRHDVVSPIQNGISYTDNSNNQSSF